MSKLQVIQTQAAPTPTGPFSQAIKKGSLLFTAGQAGRNRETGKMGDVREQTMIALENLKSILEAGGARSADIVKVTVYAREDVDVALLNEGFEALVPPPRPARTLVFVSKLKNPDMLVEIDAVAVVDA